MIYLKNSTEKQECFIPKNGNYIGRKTYKEGMEAQKALISAITIDDNGVYENENGYSPVEVALPIGKTTITENGVYDFSNGGFQKDTSIDIGGIYICEGCGYMFPVNGVGNWSLEVIFRNANFAGEYLANTMRGIIGDKNIYIAEDATDPNYIFAKYGDWESGRYAIDEEYHYLKLNEEGFWIDNVLMEVNTNNTPVEIEEWVIINGVNGFNIQETYNYPNKGYYQAVRIGFNGETKIFAYPDGNGYIDVNGEDRYSYIWKVTNNYPQYMSSESVGYGWREVRGMKEVSVNVGDCPEMPVIGTLEMDVTENQTYYRDASDGYDAYDRIIVNVNVPQKELYPLDVTENGTYEGAYNIVNVNVPEKELYPLDVTENGIYEGAYNVVNVNVPQGESCNLEDKWVTPSMDDRDDNGYVIVNPSEGYDGLSRAVINPSTIYNEGVEAGKAECDDCNLEDKWVTPSMDDRDGNGLIVVNPSEGYDGLSRAVIDPTTIYNEGVEEGKTQGGDCPELTTLDVTENGTYEGAFNVVNVEVPQEGGDCNLENVDKQLNPDENPYYIVINPSEGYDGLSQVIIRTENAFNQKIEQGRNEVRNSLGSLSITENGTYSTSDTEEIKYINFGQDGNVWYSTSNTLSSDTEIELAFIMNNENHENQVLIGGENFAISCGGGALQGVVNGIATWNRGYNVGVNDVNIVKINSAGISINENHLSWTDNESGVNLWENIVPNAIELFIGSCGSDGQGNPEGKVNFKNSILYFTINGNTFYPTEDLKFGEQTNMGTGTPTYGVANIPKYTEEGWKEINVNVAVDTSSSFNDGFVYGKEFNYKPSDEPIIKLFYNLTEAKSVDVVSPYAGNLNYQMSVDGGEWMPTTTTYDLEAGEHLIRIAITGNSLEEQIFGWQSEDFNSRFTDATTIVLPNGVIALNTMVFGAIDWSEVDKRLVFGNAIETINNNFQGYLSNFNIIEFYNDISNQFKNSGFILAESGTFIVPMGMKETYQTAFADVDRASNWTILERVDI